MTDLLAAAGIVVTEEGKARARAKLAAADAFWTEERWAELGRQVGLDDLGQPTAAQPSLDELLAAAGIVVTEEGKARARAKLAAADAFWTDERWAELDRQMGFEEQRE
jgi:hypothetical protein